MALHCRTWLLCLFCLSFINRFVSSVSAPAVPVISLSTGINGIVVGTIGSDVILTATVENDHPPVPPGAVVWLFKGSALDTASQQYTVSADGLTLIISDLVDSNEGFYSAVAANEAGVGTASVFVDIQSELQLRLSWGENKSFIVSVAYSLVLSKMCVYNNMYAFETVWHK